MKMKITLEDYSNSQLEIFIRGDISDPRVTQLVSFLKSKNWSGKIIGGYKGKEVLINVSEIHYFIVEERRTFAIINNKRYSIKYSLTEILTYYKNYGITQIGKSILVNLNHVCTLEAEINGNYLLTLSDQTTLIASRFYMKDFRNAILEQYNTEQ